MEFQVVDNGTQGKVAVLVDGKEAGFIKFKYLENGSLNAYSTLVFEEYKDMKLGMPLFEKLVAYVVDQQIKIYPTCPFVVKMFSRKPDLHHLLAVDFTFPE